MKKGRITIAATILAILVALIVVARTYIFDMLIISGDSMSPTLMHGDRILVSKLAYRHHEPDRGDIIAFKAGYRRLVKRVMGVPGETIEVKDGMLYRNGELLDDKQHPIPYTHHRNRASYRLRTVGTRHVFVMGDNRFASVDSRDFGPIPYQDIIGKATLIFFPPKRIGKLKHTL